MLKAVVIGPTTQTQACFELLAQRCRVIGVMTLSAEALQKKARAFDLAGLARERGIPAYEGPLKDPAAAEQAAQWAPDVIFEFGDSRVIPRSLLEIPPLGVIGSHGGPLPAIQGGATLNWSLILGADRWGVSLCCLGEKVDEGRIIGVASFDITDEDDITSVHRKSDEGIVSLLKDAVTGLENGDLKTRKNCAARRLFPPRKKDETIDDAIRRNNEIVRIYHQEKSGAPLFLPSRKPIDGAIDWRREPRELFNWIRALSGEFGGAYLMLGEEQVHVWKASLLSGAAGGAPGQVLDIFDGRGVVIGAGGGALLIESVSLTEGPPVPADIFFKDRSQRRRCYVVQGGA